jgi:hypothetical protein
MMEKFSKIFFELGILFVVIGGLFFLFEKFGFFKLPGDIVIKKDGFVFYFPIVTSIIISILLTLIINLFIRK